MSDRRAKFQWREFSGVSVFGYEGPFGPNKAMRPVALSHNFYTSAGGGIRLKVDAQVRMEGGKILDPLPDPTAPVSPPPPPLVAPLPCVMTLGEFCEKVNAGQFPAAGDKIRIAAEESLHPKPVCLFNGAGLGPSKILPAVAAAYGLMVAETKPGDFRISIPAPKYLKSITELPAEIERLIPDALHRVMSGGTQREIATMNQEKPDRRRDAHSDEFFGRYVATDALLNSCVRRLRSLVQDRVSPDPAATPLLLVDAGQEARCLLAVSSLLTGYHAMRKLVTMDVPDYIVNFDKAIFGFDVTLKGEGAEVGFLLTTEALGRGSKNTALGVMYVPRFNMQPHAP
jgi:hypothetical protein